ncbi:MAG: hypothetical protein WCB51_08615 [Candidatus Dormiibacterota bacterium]
MSTEDTSGDEAPERFRRQDDEPDDTEGHRAGLSSDPDFSHNLALGRPEDDERAIEKHN